MSAAEGAVDDLAIRKIYTDGREADIGIVAEVGLGEDNGDCSGDPGAAELVETGPGEVLVELKNGFNENRDAEFR